MKNVTRFTIVLISLCTAVNAIEQPLTTLDSLVSANNQLGFELFQKTNIQQHPDSNLMISPLSISTAMSMAYHGANGPCKDEMQDVMHLDGLTDNDISQSVSDLMDMLEDIEDDTLSVANSIWHRDDITLVPDFVDLCSEKYDAATRGLDFSNLSSKDSINNWVDENTGGKIPEIIDEIDPSAVLFIINAIYFKGAWQKPFDEDYTYDGDFYLSGGETTEVPFMFKTDTMKLYFGDKVSVAELPYSNEIYSMVLALPDTDYGIDSLIGELNQDMINSWELTYYNDAQIQLPKFKFEYEDDLVNEFDSLGMRMAFGGGADFSNLLSGGGIWIDKIKHKTFIDVNEKGTEAAAVTAIIMEWSMPPGINFNRPFLFMIKNNETNSIVFLGKVAKPYYSEKLGKVNDDPVQDDEIQQNSDSEVEIIYNSFEHTIEVETNGLERYNVDLIDISGRTINAQIVNEYGRLSIAVPENSSANIYFVRVYDQTRILKTVKILVY